MGVLKSFLSGVAGELRPAESLPAIPARGTPDDFRDYTNDMQNELQPGAEPVRTVDGFLDFLQEVQDDIAEWIDREAGEGHAKRPRKKPNTVLKTAVVGAVDWSPRRYNVTTGTQVASRRESRRKIRLVNWGVDLIYISQSAIPSWDVAGSVPPNVAVVPPSDLATGAYFPVELDTTDQVWARVSPSAAGSVLEVIEQYGIPE